MIYKKVDIHKNVYTLFMNSGERDTVKNNS